MICFEKKLFEKNNSLTRYDANYIFKRFLNKKTKEISIDNIDKVFNKTHSNKSSKEIENEKKRIITRLKKLEKLEYIVKQNDNRYKITEKAENEMENFSRFQFSSYDANKIFSLVRDRKYLKSIESKLLSEFDISTKEGNYDYNYIKKRLDNNIKYGFIKNVNGKLEITEKGLMEEDTTKNPHKKFINKILKNLELKSDEFKREKSIIDEKYSIDDALNYSGMIEYMDREKAKKIQSQNNIGLFTDDKDKIDSIEKSNLKNLFNKCQKNGGIMWHDVISFDNKWLEKHGLYDSKNKILDDRKLKEVVRNSVKEMLKKEQLNESAVWCADIHYNTDNIHVHISTVELNPTKTRGKRKPKSIFTMKSKVVNGIMNNNEQYKKINDIIRKDIIENKRHIKTLKDLQLKNLFLEIHSNLPEDRKQWHYNYNTLNNVRPLLDKMTEIYIEKYNKVGFKNLKEELKKQEINLKEAYGEGKNNLYKNYFDNKIKDLKTRMGNTILKEIKEYDYSLKRQEYMDKLRKKDKKEVIKNNIVAVRLRKIERILTNEYEHIKNQKEYEKLQEEIERNE